MILPFRLRTVCLRLQSRQVSRREQACNAAMVVLEEQQARERRRERTVWVKPLLLRRVTLGHFDSRHPNAGIDAGILTIVTVTVSPYSLCTDAARALYDSTESLRRLCSDCTEIARLPYNLRAASVRICLDEYRRVHSKNRTIIVYYVNTCLLYTSPSPRD